MAATLKTLLTDLHQKHPESGAASVRLSGSGALILSGTTGTRFVQEVVAAGTYLRANDPLLDVAVELGGEDAKIIYLTQGVELRMNEACAGGTGAFIDQMASLLDTDPVGLDRLAENAKRSHPIASRCGVLPKPTLWRFSIAVCREKKLPEAFLKPWPIKRSADLPAGADCRARGLLGRSPSLSAAVSACF